MFLLLTLENHKDGIWVTRLVEELLQIGVEVEIASIEDYLHERHVDDVLADCRGIINRVSDAADPVNVKKCVALLSAARLLQIPIFNGPIAYSMCCNKWCHHMVFRRAGLVSPSTAVILASRLSSSNNERLTELSQRLLQEPLPHLIKPNSGGFGAGIVKLGDDDDSNDLPLPADDTLLLQTYVPLATVSIYRVWFLLGQVQCAVERTAAGARDDEFTTGCAGNVCTGGANKPPRISAWHVPMEVREEIERMLGFLQEDAHAGSVEFLIDSTGQRLYFDLNLLSMLPVAVVNADEVWGEHYNPWVELAEAAMNVLSVDRPTFRRYKRSGARVDSDSVTTNR
jgi:hypothetical protein